MQHIVYTDNKKTLRIAILIKERNLIKAEIERHYINPLEAMGVPRKNIVVFTLKYNASNKVTAKQGNDYLIGLMKAIDSCPNIDIILCADGPYFKLLTTARKTSVVGGYVMDCKVKDFEHISVIHSINYAAMFYNDNLFDALDISLNTLVNHIKGKHTDPGTDIIHTKCVPFTPKEISEELTKLHEYPELTCDIEAFSLRFNTSNVATITFCWNKHEGIVFDVAYTDVYEKEAKILLVDFFENYEGKITYHGAGYDAKVLIYNLFMKDSVDFPGMLHGLKVFKDQTQDSMLLLYLATNSTGETPLGLKAAAHEYTGDYAQEDIEDITLIPRNDLLEYNLIDGLATWYVKEKYTPIVIKDNQMDFYNKHAQPTLNILIKMMLIGLPMNMSRVDEAEKELSIIYDKSVEAILTNNSVAEAEYILQRNALVIANNKLKTKIHSIAQFKDKKFNPGSGPQLTVLLYEVLGLPVLDLTKKKKPATGAKTLKKLINHLDKTDTVAIQLIDDLIALAQVETILTNFIRKFQELAFLRTGDHDWDGTYWLNGMLKLVTQAGRLASSDPNMQNIPSTGTIYAKLVKRCFVAPKGWLMVGADFSSLEDRINAILTKDKNKIKVYTDGYDGHCLRAHAYFSAEMPDIDGLTVESINSIIDKYPHLRQKSKSPTFALTYLGTWHTLVKNLGISQEEAMMIEANYHELYKESDAFSETITQYAADNGYVELAFGLRVRTPILAKTIIGSSRTPYEADAEGRSANNAVTQSWGQLTTRAITAFERDLEASQYQLDIFIANTIHDAIYLIIRNTPEVVKWVNDHLIKAMEWNDDPLIKSNDVPMSAELEIYYPSWAEPNPVPNYASLNEVSTILENLCPVS